MKRNVTTLAAILSTGLALASAAAFGAQHMKDMGAKGGGMQGMDPAKMQQMQQSMMKMHDLMHQMQNAKTPEERQKLQQEHMKAMQSHMQMMMPMMQGMGGMMGGHGAGKPAAGTDAHNHK